MMKSIHLFLFFLTVINSQAQTYDVYLRENWVNPSFFSLYQNSEDILITTNSKNIIFSGFIAFKPDTQGSITITAEPGYVVRIVATITDNPRNTLGTGTLLGGRPPLSGGGGLLPKISLSPNPATNIIQLQSTENIVEYKIYDAQGTLKSENKILKSKLFSANINNLLPGIYYMTVLLENGQTISKQFIKQ